MDDEKSPKWVIGSFSSLGESKDDALATSEGPPMPTQNPLTPLGEDETPRVLRALPHPSQHSLNARFPFWALDGQEPPRATESGADWRTWVIMAGRGFGKTRAGAEWVLGLVRGEGTQPEEARHGSKSHVVGRGEGRAGRARSSPELADANSGRRIALVAATVEEARAVMVEGPSGILNCARPGEIVDWSPARRTISFASGAQAFLYSGASPESLRGPEHDFAWCDELAKWRKPQATWDNLSLGLRRGAWPRAVVTTTPKAGTVLDAILALPDTVKTGGSTRTNVYLPDAFVIGMEARYAGTRLGAQELDGVLLRDVEGSLWPVALIEGSRAKAPSPRVRGEGWGEGDCPHDVAAGSGEHALPLSPASVGSVVPPAQPWIAGSNPTRHSPEGERGMFVRIVIGVDPPASAVGTCGIVVCGLDAAGKAWVLEDASVAGHSPEGWARAVAAAAARWEADRVIAEANQGGDMVKSVLRAASPVLPVKIVRASIGKAARAEPVAARFELGQAGFAGRFPALEAELTGLVPGGGYHGPGASPDRADAMVWALWALLIAPGTPPRVSRP